jgi:hypothetical protein
MKQSHKLLLVGVLLMFSSGALHAGPLYYEFSTILELESGTDTVGLDGAQLIFNAEIAEGTVFKLDIFGIGLTTYDAASHEWNVIGSDLVDGTYVDPDGATYGGSWWWGFNGYPFHFATFDNLALAHAPTVNPSIGDLVGPEHFGRFPSETLRPDLMVWATTDGSIYNWANNASFTLSGMGVVPLPGTVALLLGALPALSWFVRRRRKTCLQWLRNFPD